MADGWKRFESFPRKYSIPKVDSQVHSAPMLNREAINSFARWSRVSYKGGRNYIRILVASTR
jgi:hypothetical protein